MIQFSFELLMMLLLSGSCMSHAEVRMPGLFSDNRVIQRDLPVNVWGWADNPEGCNLYNQAGLPASPFRTDDE